MHVYARDPQSGAGNCTCGWPVEMREHPHEFRRRSPKDNDELCVCGELPEAICHELPT